MPVLAPSNITFTNSRSRTKSAEVAIVDFAQTTLAYKNVDKAIVKCTPKREGKGGESWHEGGTDPDEALHVTVEFTKDGKHVTTRHVYHPGY